MRLDVDLDRNGQAYALLLSHVRQLASADWQAEPTTGHIRRLRTAALYETPADSAEDQVLRVCMSALADLRAQGWAFEVEDDRIVASEPQPEAESPLEEKARVRAGLLLERDEQLRKATVRRFVSELEQRRPGPNGGWVSIFSLMRDGRELGQALRRANAVPEGPDRWEELRGAVDPYLQVVDDGVCEHTGLQLKDIWRYFRYTWVSPSKTVPGRNVWFLVRDAAAQNHPVIGIAALGSAIVQLGVRDRWIGWNGDQFVRVLRAEADDSWAEWLENAIASQLDGI